MKTLIAVSLLLALISPAFAAGRAVSPAQWETIHELSKAHGHCGGYDGEDDLELKQTCATADRLGKKLEAQGFCLYGHIAVGWTGKPWTQKQWERTGGQGTVFPKGRKHCYAIRDPSR